MAYRSLRTFGLLISVSCLLPGQGSKAPAPPVSTRSNTLPSAALNGTDRIAAIPYITGTVKMEDGTPPPESVLIERYCGPRRTPAAHTDSQGHFSFQMNRAGEMILPDASESSAGPGLRQTGNAGSQTRSSAGDCELLAVMPGYRSDTVYLGRLRRLDDSNIGTIVLHRVTNATAPTVSATLLNAPKDARAAYDRAIEEVRSGKPDAAMEDLHRAVELHPTFAAAWYQLGHLQMAADPSQARVSLSKSIAADAKYVSPYLDLALIEVREKHWNEALEATSKAIQLNAVDYPLVYFYRSVAEFNTDHLDDAEKSALQADRLDTGQRYPKIQQLLAEVLMQKHDYVGAAEHMREYLKRAPKAPDAEKSRVELAAMEKASEAKR